MNIIDIMATNLINVGTKTTVTSAIKIMQENDVRHLIVIAGDGSLQGIVSDRDLRLATQSPYAVYDIEKADAFADSLLIEQVMTRTPHCVSPHFSVAEVASMMVEHHINAVPVLQDSDLIGIVTSTDLLKVLAAQPV